MRTAVLILGIVLTAWAIAGIVRSMLVLGNSLSITDRIVNASITKAGYAVLGLIRTYRLQDRWLSFLAPIVLLIRLLIYVVILIFTTGLIVYGCTDLSLIDSLYQAAATLTTLGIVEPVNFSSTVTVIFAAFVGLVIIAIFIGYLLSMYSAVMARESVMARLSPLSGEPAWAPQVIARAHVLHLPAEQAPVVMDWVGWISDLRMNQRSNPLQSEIRSPSEHRHWVITLLAVLDVVALRIALDGKDQPHDIQLLTEGSVTMSLLEGPSIDVRNWDIQIRIRQAALTNTDAPVDPATAAAAQLSEEEWQAGIRALQAVDYPLPDDLEAAFNRFVKIRSIYATHACNLAYRFHAVRAPWSGPRRTNLEVIWPEIAGEVRTKS